MQDAAGIRDKDLERLRKWKTVRYKDDDGFAFAPGRAVNHGPARKIALIYGQVSDGFPPFVHKAFLSAWVGSQSAAGASINRSTAHDKILRASL